MQQTRINGHSFLRNTKVYFELIDDNQDTGLTKRQVDYLVAMWAAFTNTTDNIIFLENNLRGGSAFVDDENQKDTLRFLADVLAARFQIELYAA